MKLSTKSLAITMAVFLGRTVFFVTFFNYLSPPYGKAFLDMASSVYPGYKSVGELKERGAGDALRACRWRGRRAILGWLYNRFVNRVV